MIPGQYRELLNQMRANHAPAITNAPISHNAATGLTGAVFSL